jgi:PAS domain-containing protein
MSPGTNTTTIQLTQLFDHLDGAVYIADMATYEVLYINPFLRQLFGDVEGSLCWESLQSGRQEGPCEFCTNSRLLDSAGRPVTIAHWESTETLDGRGYSLQDQAIEWPDGRMVKLVVATDISARLRSEKALRFLAESSPQPDPDPFFQQALSQLAECCGARWAFVARLTGEGQKAVRTLTFYDRGHFSPPVTWLLNGSPCERLGPGKVNLIDAGVREQFPSDLLLQTLAVESHFCTALMAGDRALGVLVVMNDGPMVILSNTAFILRSFAVRMAAEIQRMESSAESRSGSIATRDHADQELNFATSVFHNSLEAIMITDADDRIIRVNPAFTQITGYSEQEIIGQPVSILRSDREGPEFYQAISDSFTTLRCSTISPTRKRISPTYSTWPSMTH